MPTLPEIVRQGRLLLEESEPTVAHRRFLDWSDDVADWLDESFPESGLSAQWSALPSSALVIRGAYYDQPETWNHYARAVQDRLKWLGAVNQLEPKTATQPRRRPGAPIK